MREQLNIKRIGNVEGVEQLNIKKDPVMQEEYERTVEYKKDPGMQEEYGRTVEYKKGSGNVGGVWENS